MERQANMLDIEGKLLNDLQILQDQVKELNSIIKKDTAIVDNEIIPIFENILSNCIRISRENGLDHLIQLEQTYDSNSDLFFMWLNNYVKNNSNRISRYSKLKEMSLSDFASLIETYFDSCILKKFYDVTPFKDYSIEETIKIIKNLESLVRKCIVESDSKITFVKDLVEKYDIDSDKASYLFVLIDNNYEKLSMRVMFEKLQRISGSLSEDLSEEK